MFKKLLLIISLLGLGSTCIEIRANDQTITSCDDFVNLINTDTPNYSEVAQGVMQLLSNDYSYYSSAELTDVSKLKGLVKDLFPKSDSFRCRTFIHTFLNKLRTKTPKYKTLNDLANTKTYSWKKHIKKIRYASKKLRTNRYSRTELKEFLWKERFQKQSIKYEVTPMFIERWVHLKEGQKFIAELATVYWMHGLPEYALRALELLRLHHPYLLTSEELFGNAILLTHLYYAFGEMNQLEAFIKGIQTNATSELKKKTYPVAGHPMTVLEFADHLKKGTSKMVNQVRHSYLSTASFSTEMVISKPDSNENYSVFEIKRLLTYKLDDENLIQRLRVLKSRFPGSLDPKDLLKKVQAVISNKLDIKSVLSELKNKHPFIHNIDVNAKTVSVTMPSIKTPQIHADQLTNLIDLNPNCRGEIVLYTRERGKPTYSFIVLDQTGHVMFRSKHHSTIHFGSLEPKGYLWPLNWAIRDEKHRKLALLGMLGIIRLWKDPLTVWSSMIDQAEQKSTIRTKADLITFVMALLEDVPNTTIDNSSWQSLVGSKYYHLYLTNLIVHIASLKEKGKPYIHLLNPFFKAHNSFIETAAIKAVQAIKQKDSVDTLMSELNSDDSHIRIRAMYALIHQLMHVKPDKHLWEAFIVTLAPFVPELQTMISEDNLERRLIAYYFLDQMGKPFDVKTMLKHMIAVVRSQRRSGSLSEIAAFLINRKIRLFEEKTILEPSHFKPYDSLVDMIHPEVSAGTRAYSIKSYILTKPSSSNQNKRKSLGTISGNNILHTRLALNGEDPNVGAFLIELLDGEKSSKVRTKIVESMFLIDPIGALKNADILWSAITLKIEPRYLNKYDLIEAFLELKPVHFLSQIYTAFTKAYKKDARDDGWYYSRPYLFIIQVLDPDTKNERVRNMIRKGLKHSDEKYRFVELALGFKNLGSFEKTYQTLFNSVEINDKNAGARGLLNNQVYKTQIATYLKDQITKLNPDNYRDEQKFSYVLNLIKLMKPEGALDWLLDKMKTFKLKIDAFYRILPALRTFKDPRVSKKIMSLLAVMSKQNRPLLVYHLIGSMGQVGDKSHASEILTYLKFEKVTYMSGSIFATQAKVILKLDPSLCDQVLPTLRDVLDQFMKFSPEHYESEKLELIELLYSLDPKSITDAMKSSVKLYRTLENVSDRIQAIQLWQKIK